MIGAWQLRDFAYACRRLGRAPGFSAATVLIFAVGVGATTALFGHVNNVLLKPLVLPDGERLVGISPTHDKYRREAVGLLAKDLVDLEALQFTTIETITYVAPLRTIASFDSEARVVSGETVSGNYFSVLGVRPRLGRLLSPSDDTADATAAVVISETAWHRWFGGRGDVLGRTIMIGGQQLPVVGVVPSSFRGVVFGNVLGHDIWIPRGVAETVTHATRKRRDHKEFGVIARLRDGISFTQADAEVRTLGRALDPDDPDDGLALVDIQRYFAPPFLFAGAGAGLLALSIVIVALAGANVLLLSLSRVVERRGELALRFTLGASSTQIVGLVLTETAVVAVCGGSLGLLAAWWITSTLGAIDMPIIRGRVFRYDAAPDLHVFGYAVTATAVAALAISGALAKRVTDVASLTSMAGAGTGGTPPESKFRARVVSFQLACSVLLVVTAALFLRSANRDVLDPPKLSTSGVTIGQFDLFLEQFEPGEGRVVQNAVLRMAAALPGVSHAALGSALPVRESGAAQVYEPESSDRSRRSAVTCRTFSVSPEYFDVLGIATSRGRVFGSDAGSAVITSSLANRFWPDEDPVGKRFRTRDRGDRGPLFEVIGVVPDLLRDAAGDGASRMVFIPIAQNYHGRVMLLLHSTLPPSSLIGRLKDAIAKVDGAPQIFDVTPLDEHLAASRGAARTATLVLWALASVGLGLAVTGIYATVSYTIHLRHREIGIMKALGASSFHMYTSLVREQAHVTGRGIAAGLVVSMLCAAFLGALLGGRPWADWPAFAFSALFLAGASLGSTLCAARRLRLISPDVLLKSR